MLVKGKTLCFVAFVCAFAFIATGAFAQEVTSSGALSYTYPLDIPAGRNGMGPQLSLVYNSNAGNGMLGVGWSLGGLSIITRDSSYPITFVDAGTGADHFLLDGQKLIVGTDGKYHTEKESYVKIEFVNPDTAAAHWIVTLKNGTKMFYGHTNDGEHVSTNDGNVTAVGQGSRALVWCLSRVEDVLGNYYVIEYNEDTVNGDYYPVKIVWTKHANGQISYFHTVEFWYDSLRTDKAQVYAPSYLNMDLRMRYIAVKSMDPADGTDKLARLYRINYIANDPDTGKSMIADIVQIGSDANPPSGVTPPVIDASYVPSGSTLPPTKFDWNILGLSYPAWPAAKELDYHTTYNPFYYVDVNGDGKTDLVSRGTNGYIYIGLSNGNSFAANPWTWNSGTKLVESDGRLYFGDVNGDGKMDLLINNNKSKRLSVRLSQGDNYSVQSWYQDIFPDNLAVEIYFVDVNGDGRCDLIRRGGPGISNPPVFPPPPTDPNAGWIYVALSNGSTFQNWTWTSQKRMVSDTAIVHFSDVNGDGKNDLIVTDMANKDLKVALSDGCGFGNYNTDGYVSWSWTQQDIFPYFSPDVRFAEINGDGKIDLIFLKTNYDELYLGLSTGMSFIKWTKKIDFQLHDNLSSFVCWFTDVNGDGRDDIYKTIQYVNNYGPGGMEEIWLSCGNNISKTWYRYGELNTTHVNGVADINGDGRSDTIRIQTLNNIYYNKTVAVRTDTESSTGQKRAPDVIGKITLPAGGTISLTYKPAPQVPGAVDPSKTDLSANKVAAANPQNLVTSIAYGDGFGSTVRTNYEYSNHLVYRGASGFPYERVDLGFEWIRKIDANPGSASEGAYTKTWYRQDVPYEGLVRKVQTFDRYDRPYTETEYTYFHRTDATTGNPDVTFVYKTGEISRNFNGDAIDPVEYRINFDPNPEAPSADACWYDEHGNLTRADNDGDIVEQGDETSVVTEWIHNTAGMVHVPKKITKKAKSLDFPAGALVTASEQRYWYDNQSEGVVTNGLVTKKEIENGNDDVTLTYGYDATGYGTLVWFKDGKANAATPTYTTVTYIYDTQYKTYPVTATNAAGMTTTTAYDNLMRPVSVTDMNGQVWSTVYDIFGRVVKSIAPDDTEASPTKEYVYNDVPVLSGGVITTPVGVRSTQKQTDANTIPVYNYYDGLGRSIQTKSQIVVDATTIWDTVDFFYDKSGRQDKSSIPYAKTSSAWSYPDTSQKYVLTSYDEIGRPVSTTNTDGTISYTVYEKNRIVSIDEKGNATSKQIIGNSVIEKSYNDPAGDYSPLYYPSASDPAYYAATTTAAWNGVRIEDSGTGTEQAVVSTVCNMLGRKTSYTDRNMGTWAYTYDRNGNLLTQTDAKAQTLTFDYDTLNRVKSKKHGTNVLASYTYGDELTPVPANARGRLVSVTGPSGGEYYTYDDRGRIASIGIVISSLDSNPRYYGYAYNAADQLVTETYPTGEVLTYYYNSAGQLEKVTGTKSAAFENFEYAKDIGYTTLNKLKAITYHNNVTTTYDYYDSDTEQDQANGNRKYSYRLRNIHVQKAGAPVLADTVYEYDAVDNIMKKTFHDGYGGDYSETFAYDDLNRLISADGSVIPDKPIYGYKEFEYLPNNNIATKDGRTFLYNATVVRDGQTVTLPHAVSEIKDDAGNTLYAYEYDRNGNMTRAVGQSTITIRAKKGAGSLTPRMELWLNGIQYQAWLVDNDEYHDYTWSGRLDNTGTIDVIYVNGDEAADLFVEHVTVNGTTILTSDTTKVVFDPGEYYGGCVDNIDITAGQVPLTQTGGLHFSANGIAALDRTITYDTENRVASITENGNTSVFIYDYSGTRIRKTETFNGVTTTTYYIGGKYEITNRSGQPTKLISYYFANGQRIAQRTDDSTTSEMLYYHTDHLGSAVRLTNEEGEPVQSIAYAPFGETVFYSGVKDPKYQYTGQEFDAPSGLYYYGARYYCPEIGRFIQPDTFLDGLNRYAYCWNNPMNYVDPTGQEACAYGGGHSPGENGGTQNNATSSNNGFGSSYNESLAGITTPHAPDSNKGGSNPGGTDSAGGGDLNGDDSKQSKADKGKADYNYANPVGINTQPHGPTDFGPGPGPVGRPSGPNSKKSNDRDLKRTFVNVIRDEIEFRIRYWRKETIADILSKKAAWESKQIPFPLGLIIFRGLNCGPEYNNGMFGDEIAMFDPKVSVNCIDEKANTHDKKGVRARGDKAQIKESDVVLAFEFAQAAMPWNPITTDDEGRTRSIPLINQVSWKAYASLGMLAFTLKAMTE